MKAYFTASFAGKKYHKQDYIQIVDILRANSINCKADHILQMSEERVHMESRDERLHFHVQLEHEISSSDFVVAECSFPSISVGYEISLALHKGKPVLVLYTTASPPTLLAHHKDEKLVCEQYTTSSLSEIISSFLEYISSKTDTRFTFFLTSKQHMKIEEKAHQQGIPKAVYLRQLIDKDQ